MLALDFAIETIAEVTGLLLDQVKEIKEKKE